MSSVLLSVIPHCAHFGAIFANHPLVLGFSLGVTFFGMVRSIGYISSNMLERWVLRHSSCHAMSYIMSYSCHTPPPPVPRNRLAQEPPPGSTVEFSHYFFFYHGIGFFMVLVDAGQLFRCAGQHCVAMGPPIRGDAISQSQAHIPLKPLPPALDPLPEATSP